MSVFTDISSALNARLNTLPGSAPVAWENYPYDPVAGTLYLRPTLIPDDAVSYAMGATGTDQNSGVFQIDVIAPSDKGRGEAYTKADAIAEHFRPMTELTYNSRLVRCIQASIRVATQDNGWFILPVRVEYLAYTTKR